MSTLDCMEKDSKIKHFIIVVEAVKIFLLKVCLLTFLLPEVSLSSVSMPPLNDTGDRVPSTDSSLINLKGDPMVGTVLAEWMGVDWVVVLVLPG